MEKVSVLEDNKAGGGKSLSLLDLEEDGAEKFLGRPSKLGFRAHRGEGSGHVGEKHSGA